jgi:hypothetical protein
MNTERLTEALGGRIGEVRARRDFAATLAVAGGEWAGGALADAVRRGLFTGAKVYANHRDRAEVARRGHRDLRDWCGTVREGVRYEDGAVIGRIHVHNPAAVPALADPTSRTLIGLQLDATVTRTGEAVTRVRTIHGIDLVPEAEARFTEALTGDVQEALDAEAALREDLRRRGVPDEQADRMIAARPLTADPFADRCRRSGVTDPQVIDRLRRAR